MRPCSLVQTSLLVTLYHMLVASQPRSQVTLFCSLLLFHGLKMFEMDSYVGVDVLGLSFMKGDQPHAGFPEAAYAGMAEQLARAGHRVVVVEQVGRGQGGGLEDTWTRGKHKHCLI
jgi:hypothetical protein